MSVGQTHGRSHVSSQEQGEQMASSLEEYVLGGTGQLVGTPEEEFFLLKKKLDLFIYGGTGSSRLQGCFLELQRAGFSWRGLLCCREWTLGPLGSGAVVHRLRCSVACGIVTDQGSWDNRIAGDCRSIYAHTHTQHIYKKVNSAN